MSPLNTELLSADGEKLVDEEVKRALYGVKQMKEAMLLNQQKHQHLMKSLRHSGDKKKGAAQLARDVTEKLQEAEEACKHSLQAEWEQCRPCLEDACKSFYTSACRRRFAAFHAKVGAFFQRISERFSSRQLAAESGDILVNQGLDSTDLDVDRIEDSFNRLLRRVSWLVERSAGLVSRMSSRLDRALQTAFLNQTRAPAAPPTLDPLDPARDSGFMQGVGLEEVLESFFDFGKSVVEEFGAVVTRVFDDLQQAAEQQDDKERESAPQVLQDRQLCRSLRRQTSECWRLQTQCRACQGTLLTECPSVQELHVELEEASQLLEVSRDQYQEVLSIVRRHADDTVGWLSAVASELSWLGRAVSDGGAPQNIFTVTKVALDGQDEGEEPADRRVELNILNSPLSLTLPGQLQPLHPAFIQQLVQDALLQYKETARSEDE
ncbi:clusterin-like protein 1 [Salarias fasciatus]|uniref:clusterin-like protein 1 n=2 Tax=Salarias fasciatus TaxID=181472 RepID=UPI0011766681|nr:clusterin-like protein 1 [Salarias fasciatus]